MPKGGAAERTETFVIRVKPGAKARVRAEAERKGWSMSEVIRMALNEGMAILEKR